MRLSAWACTSPAPKRMLVGECARGEGSFPLTCLFCWRWVRLGGWQGAERGGGGAHDAGAEPGGDGADGGDGGAAALEPHLRLAHPQAGPAPPRFSCRTCMHKGPALHPLLTWMHVGVFVVLRGRDRGESVIIHGNTARPSTRGAPQGSRASLPPTVSANRDLLLGRKRE